jgi:arylsulfatase A-like enzyme
MKLTRVVCAFLVCAACSGDKQAGGSESPAAIKGNGGGAGGGAARTKPDVDKRTQRPAEHAVFSLVDNRLLAHVQHAGGIVIPAGSAGFAKYLRFRKTSMPFEIRQDRDGVKVARLAGTSGGVLVPLTEAQAQGDPMIRVRHYNEQPRRITVRVNGKDVSTVEAAAGWSTSEVQVPNGRLEAGENDVTLFIAKGKPMDVDWIQVGGSAAPASTPQVYDAKQTMLRLGDGQQLAWYVMVPDEGMLVGDVVGAGCKVAVTATPDKGKPITGALEGRGGAVKLDALAGTPVRLQLAAEGCTGGGLANAVLAVPGEAPAVETGDKPEYIVFWIMDSLRADRVPTFVTGARPETPFFDELAKTSTIFANAYVQGNESRVSHASIWSSLYPVKHDMLSSKAKLAEKWVTLDEVMDEAGKFTSGVSGNGYVVEKWGFGDAWDRYRNHIHEGGGLNGEDILGKAIASVEDKLESPFFLYIGTIDTHVSWRAKEPWLSKYDTEPYSGPFKTVASGRDMGKVAGGKMKITERDKDRIRAIYDSNVSYQDDLLRQLWEKLTEWGIADKTMLVVTADHGDEQWEVGRVGHGGSLRESLVHVPLLIHYPPLFPAVRVEEGAEVIDILPTLADVTGVTADEEWQGESLVPLANGVGRGYPRMAMASQYEGAHTVRMGAWKLRVSGGNKPTLYNLVDNPDETEDVVDDAPIARRFLGDPLWMLRTYNLQWQKSRWGNAANATPQLAADLGE